MGLLASLVCLTPLLAYIYCKDVVGIVGENFTFPVQIDKKIVETVWKKNKNKVAEWEGQDKPMYFGNFSNRTVLMENGSLTIFNLEKDDAGPYELQYWDSGGDHYLNFVLVVLDSLPEPKISCNTSDGELLLNCTAHFQASLNYSWKFSNNPRSHHNQELSISLKNVDTTTKATCIIEFSQTQRSSEISLSQCRPEGKGDHSYKRNRGALVGVFAVIILLVLGILIFLYWKGKIKLGARRRTAQNNSLVNGSGEHEQLFLGNSQQQPNSEGAESSQAVHCGNEEPEAGNKCDGAPKERNMKEEKATQDAEGGNGEHLNGSHSCSKEDLKA